MQLTGYIRMIYRLRKTNKENEATNQSRNVCFLDE